MPPATDVLGREVPLHSETDAHADSRDESAGSGDGHGDLRRPQHSERCDPGNHSVTTALLLAAGAGTRLRPRSNGFPKCLTEVCGIPILGRLVSCLIDEGFERLVVIVGHRGDQIREYLDLHASGLRIDCIDCHEYAVTNNIYSLWLAREHICEPFVLIESDLVFDSRLLGLLRSSNRIAVARLRSHMHGTTVSFDDSGRIESFAVGAPNAARQPYKTVNLYSLSSSVWREVGRRLEHRIASGRVHDYYEVVFADMAAEGSLPFQAVYFDDGRWCEIDTPDDLVAAEQLFSASATSGPGTPNGSCRLDRT
jgi:NDP-sugar pyrophosphorylase family protein